MSMISDEYLEAIRERARNCQPGGLKAMEKCTCATCARVVLLEEVDRLRTELDDARCPANWEPAPAGPLEE